MGRGQGGKSKGGVMCRHVRKEKHPIFLDKKEMSTTLKKKKHLVLLVNLLQN